MTFILKPTKILEEKWGVSAAAPVAVAAAPAGNPAGDTGVSEEKTEFCEPNDQPEVIFFSQN